MFYFFGCNNALAHVTHSKSQFMSIKNHSPKPKSTHLMATLIGIVAGFICLGALYAGYTGEMPAEFLVLLTMITVSISLLLLPTRPSGIKQSLKNQNR
ncbi:MAG: hypothetical protein KF725_13290 [Cyclobacteriaceae bacterium]|nr:hypothetical protein [Cyclobacteriaceae bacterium]UYN85402.1 MAG: hypothetical protein KIT51_10925 [Cyclobacteriaceae bacterium]